MTPQPTQFRVGLDGYRCSITFIYKGVVGASIFIGDDVDIGFGTDTGSGVDKLAVCFGGMNMCLCRGRAGGPGQVFTGAASGITSASGRGSISAGFSTI